MIFTLIKLCASPFLAGGRFAGFFGLVSVCAVAGAGCGVALAAGFSAGEAGVFTGAVALAAGTFTAAAGAGAAFASGLTAGVSASAQNARNSSPVHSLISTFSMPALD